MTDNTEKKEEEPPTSEKGASEQDKTDEKSFTDTQLFAGVMVVILSFALVAFAMSGGGGGADIDGDVSEFNFPDWADENSIEPDQALQSHTQLLEEQSFTLSADISSEAQEQEQTSEFTYQYSSESDSAFGVQETDGQETQTYEDYAEQQIYIANMGEGTYEREFLNQPPFTGGDVVVQFLSFSEIEAVGTTNDGSVVVYEITALTEDFQQEAGDIDIEGQFHLHEDGYFTHISVQIDEGEAGTTSTQNIDITDVGSTTFEEPEWLPEAIEQTEFAEEPEPEGDELPDDIQLE